ncbi:MAG: hypothetical protein AAGM38_02705 [Pseudomonadota bacterium]
MDRDAFSEDPGAHRPEAAAPSEARALTDRLKRVIDRLAAPERAPEPPQRRRGFSARAAAPAAQPTSETASTPIGDGSEEESASPAATPAPAAPTSATRLSDAERRNLAAVLKSALKATPIDTTDAAPLASGAQAAAQSDGDLAPQDDAAARLDIIMPPVPPERSDLAGPLWTTGAWPRSGAMAAALLCLAGGGWLLSLDQAPSQRDATIHAAQAALAPLERPIGPSFDAAAFETATVRAPATAALGASFTDDAGSSIETGDARAATRIATASLPPRAAPPRQAQPPYLSDRALAALLSARPIKCVVPAPRPGGDPLAATQARDLDALRLAGSLGAPCVETVTYQPGAALLRREAVAPEGARIEVNAAYSVEDNAICHQTRGLTALVVGGDLPERSANSLERLLDASYAALNGAPICHRLQHLGDGPEGPVFRAVAYVGGKRSAERTDPRPFVMRARAQPPLPKPRP